MEIPRGKVVFALYENFNYSKIKLTNYIRKLHNHLDREFLNTVIRQATFLDFIVLKNMINCISNIHQTTRTEIWNFQKRHHFLFLWFSNFGTFENTQNVDNCEIFTKTCLEKNSLWHIHTCTSLELLHDLLKVESTWWNLKKNRYFVKSSKIEKSRKA